MSAAFPGNPIELSTMRLSPKPRSLVLTNLFTFIDQNPVIKNFSRLGDKRIVISAL